jgi:hypothetical protein
MKRRVEPPSHPALMRMDNGSFDAAKFEELLEFLLE